MRSALVKCGVGSVFVALAALVGLVAPASAASTTIYVDKGAANCSDSGAGSSSQPFCTITKAGSVAVADELVLVSSGTYAGGVSIAHSGTSGAPIVFQPAAGATVTLNGGSSAFTVSSQSWITIRGFNVTGTADYGMNLKSSSNLVIDGNNVSGAGQRATGETASGIKLASVTSSLITGNTTHDNSDHGINVASSSGNEIKNNTSYGNARAISRAAAGIFLANSTGNTIDGNVTHDNEDTGIAVWTASNNNSLFNNVMYKNGDHGIDDLHSTGLNIVSNTVYRNVDSGIEMQGDAGATLMNNISVDNGVDSPRTAGNIRVVDSGSAARTTLDYDLLYLSSDTDLIDYLGVSYSSLSAFRTATGMETHGVAADPLFANAGSGDFHLMSDSPAIDSANSGATAQPATDRDGRARVDDANVANTGVGPRAYDDRGAYERVAPK